MRSFCVIPHAVRDAPFYNGVFEDGVRLSVDGRLTPLPFSRVLSPAHQVATFVLDPLWAHMELCQNSTLLVCLPSTDPLGGTSEASSEQVDDCHGVVEDLYAQYFSSLFLHAPQSTEALVSVMSISVEDRCVYDHLQRMRVGNPSQAMRERLPASPDSHLWGTILQLATERHEALAHPEVSSAIIASQTAWVTVVELPGNGRHLVVEVGSDQSVLQTLSLILGMRGATGSPSYPPQGPLRVVLESNVAPDACVHVVAIPDGRCRPHYSLRVLRFASSCASRESTRRRGKAAQTTEGVKRSIPPSTHHETIAAMQESSSMTTPSEPPPSTSEAVPPFSCATAETLGAGVATDGESSVAPIEPILQASTPLSGQSPRRLSTHTHTSPSSPKSLPPPPQISAEEHARTSHLQRLVASLEAQLQHSTMTLVNEREKLEHWRLRAEHSQEEAKSNMLLVTTMKADVHRLEKSNQGTADQLRRQLKHVGSLEKGLMVLKAEHESLQSQLRVKTTEAARHEAANAELRRAVLRHEKRLELSKGAKETASSSVMMPSSSPAPSSHRSPENVRGPARPRIIDGKGSPDEKGIAAEEDAASSLTQRDRVAIIALEELRRRNAVLERELDLVMQENSTLRDAGLHRRSQPVGECPRCQELETHLELAVGELEEMQKEIARQSSPASAQAVVQESIPTTKGRHPGEPMPPGRVGGLNDLSSQLHVANNGITQEGWMTFDAAAAALVAGCESLMVQLQGINHTQRRILAEVHGPIISSSLLSEHLHSVRAVQEAIDDIRNRQLSRDFPRIVIATAADAAALHELLSFEATRCLHLRAFIPTFTQLAVATEHLNMRLYTSRFDEASDRATKRVYSCV